MPNEVCLVFLNAALVPAFGQLRRELARFSGVSRFESIAWRGPTPRLPRLAKLLQFLDEWGTDQVCHYMLTVRHDFEH